MKTSVIWNVSDRKPFPLDLWKHPKITIQVNQVKTADIQSLSFDSHSFHFLFLQVNASEWKQLRPILKQSFDSQPYLSLIIVYSEDASEVIYDEVKTQSKYLVLENPLHTRELRIILDRSIQTEFYKHTALEIGNTCLENVGFFEGVFSLAHKEYEDSKKENLALKSILDYEEQVKKSQLGINSAMDRMIDLKNQELIELHERVKASEQLDQLREKELKQALELQKATEQVLNYSRIEEMQLDKILRAQDKLFAYTESEIKELIEENKRLKKQLGLT
ncbi:hypothetical protein LPTSP4_07110 [Leptospira ryugenii]|uniref:Uncharacterized protein n=1 Tax=Leptospira ryugenii TaxID=1917863 RepID=A0A2P2DX50_9LEPT|nr:hypothetical protein [Leptospira ryugenii]GBF49201.1 hypothetical protein LPTSP4_07110 [Leptospira ryugenii]